MNAQMIEKLETATNALSDLLEMAKSETLDMPTEGTSDPHPWLTEARRWEGLDEVDDNEKLQAFLGIDPEEVSWCAAFANRVLEATGHPTTGTLRARDFADYGLECECETGAIAVFRSHVGFVSDNKGKLLGGNQGNAVKESNLQWYHDNMVFLGYRWPVA